MFARVLIGGMIMLAVAAGILLYYLQEYAFYYPVTLEEEPIKLTSIMTGEPEDILITDYEALNANSSPIRFRACFRSTSSLATLTETYQLYEDAVPLNGPRQLPCYDAEEIGAALEDGSALAFLGEKNVTYGIDRVVAILVDGRAFAWHQINPCGEVVFNGDPAPQGCPEPPASLVRNAPDAQPAD